VKVKPPSSILHQTQCDSVAGFIVRNRCGTSMLACVAKQYLAEKMSALPEGASRSAGPLVVPATGVL
jgi:hypothetical protein